MEAAAAAEGAAVEPVAAEAEAEPEQKAKPQNRNLSTEQFNYAGNISDDNTQGGPQFPLGGGR